MDITVNSESINFDEQDIEGAEIHLLVHVFDTIVLRQKSLIFRNVLPVKINSLSRHIRMAALPGNCCLMM